MDAVELSIFNSRLQSLCDEMGALLQRTALSTNIRDRLDFSCAVFDAHGRLAAQAAHIPVHLGSMGFAMAEVVAAQHWQPGQMLIFNDPFLGGTHLPDVTLLAPVFAPEASDDTPPFAFVANRAHHADIGSEQPGSMPISRKLDEEGLTIEPRLCVIDDRLDPTFIEWLAQHLGEETQADLIAQLSANRLGRQRLLETWPDPAVFQRGLDSLNAYARRLAASTLEGIPNGDYRFEDVLDDDGIPPDQGGSRDIPIRVTLRVSEQQLIADFDGTSQQVAGNVNCPLSVAAAAVYYVFRCLMPPQVPACAGAFEAIEIRAPHGCLLNAQRPAAVAAGNVETSTRVVDVVLGALAQVLPKQIPAASHGSMNNLAMGARAPRWDYYETIGGGMGAGPTGPGLSAVQTHMTNTLNSPIEVLETRYPLRIERYAIRRGSGGAGLHRGGDGLIREYEFLAPAQATVLSERRRHAPWGLAGGEPGQCGENRLNGELLAGKQALTLQAGDRLSIATPGAGGWGRAQPGQCFEAIAQAGGIKASALMSAVSGLSVAQIKQAMACGALWLQHPRGPKKQAQATRPLRRASHRLTRGDHLFLYWNPHLLEQQPLAVEKIADLEQCSVWNKPAGMRCEGSKWGDHLSLIQAVKRARGKDRPVFLVHRLDQAASGLIAVAHSKSAARALSAQFAQRTVLKRYQVRVHGKVEDWPQPPGKPHELNSQLDGKTALSQAELIQAESDSRLLLQLSIETGRKHQIRRQLAAIGFPVVGDRLYSKASENQHEDKESLQLRCIELSLNHPETGERLSWTLETEDASAC